MSEAPPAAGRLRLLDLGFTLLFAPVWCPLLLLGMSAAALSQGLPVFYRAERIGRRRQTFRMLKIRTMVREAERLGPGVSSSTDLRVTAVGRILRRAKLDELPQFLHVLRGDMSIVGPRPEAPAYLPYYTPAGHRSLEAKPGITGYGALLFFSAEASLPADDFEEHYVHELLPIRLLLDERCWLDLQARPLWTILRVIALTLAAIVQKRSAGLSPLQLQNRLLR